MPKIYYVEYWIDHDLLPTTVFFGKKSNAESFVKKLKKQYGWNVTAIIKEGKIQMIETEEE
jgi:hypothetical protein